MLNDVWIKPAVMGWMFLPSAARRPRAPQPPPACWRAHSPLAVSPCAVKPYHAGGDAASFEPYTEHLEAYRFALSQYLGAGCGMTYRGDKLFDAFGDASHAMVKERVAWFKVRERAV